MSAVECLAIEAGIGTHHPGGGALEPRQINPRAPVTVAQEARTTAPPSEVWRILTAVDRWVGWHRAIAFATLRGDLAEGAALHWRIDGMSFLSRIRVLEPERRIGWSLRTFGVRGFQLWTLEEAGAGTLIRCEDSLEGIMPFLLRRTMTRTLDRSRAAWVQALAERARAARDR